MATLTCKKAELKNFRVMARVCYPCTLLPEGQGGVVEFNGAVYTVLALGNDPRDGFRMVNMVNGQEYDLDTSRGYPVCDCPSATYRPECQCKHSLALQKMRNQGAV